MGGFRIGGYEILSVKLANQMAERNNDIAILSLSQDMQILERVGPSVRTYVVVRKYKLDFSIVYRIFEALRDFQPDIILSCFYFEYLLGKIASFLYSKKPKCILAFHQTEPFDSKEERWFRLYAFLTKLFNDHYIAIHKTQIDFYNTHYGLPKNRFALIHNGVDVNYFRPNGTRNVKDDRIFRIVHIASLKPLKDQWTLLKAMAELNKIYRTWELKIVGTDQANILSRYADFAKTNNIATKVKFLGPVKDTHNILINSDVFVLTSITEALPLSVIEAIASGLPCIVTDVGGNSDIIDDGKEGFLVKAGDYRAIAHYLKFLIDNPTERKKMGIAARQKAIRKFDYKLMLDKYNSLFQTLVNK